MSCLLEDKLHEREEPLAISRGPLAIDVLPKHWMTREDLNEIWQ